MARHRRAPGPPTYATRPPTVDDSGLPTDDTGRRGRLPRLGVAAVVGVLAALLVVVSAGLLTTPVGAADNGDGGRLFCGAGLTPLTPTHRANWQGGVVTEFATGGRPCADPIVSSALPLLRLAAVGSGPTFSLVRLGALYALLVGVAAAVAAWALAGRGSTRLLLLVAPLAPLASPTFTRFTVSTYGEPAGLLGACVLLLGVAVLAGTRRADRPERAAGLLLTAGGGVLAATAKASALPLLVLAVLVCAATALQLGRRPRRRDHAVGAAVAVVAVLAALVPLTAALAWQQRVYGVVNAHNLVFTTVLAEVGDTALAPLGLPPAAAPYAGRAFYPENANGYPGSEVVAADPAAVRATAYRLLLTDPGAALRAGWVGARATLGADVGYLPSAPWTPGTPAPVLGPTVGEQGADRAQLQAWLAGLPVPWLPAAVGAAGLLLGLVGRRGSRVAVGAARTAALTAVGAAALVATAVLGDGFFEVAKHVWLAAYLLCACGSAVVVTLAVFLAAALGPALVPGPRRAGSRHGHAEHHR